MLIRKECDICKPGTNVKCFDKCDFYKNTYVFPIKGKDIKHDMVNQPPHYTHGGIETIDYMKAKMNNEQFIGYLVGNIIKYVSRFPFKNGKEDLEKAKWYLNKLIETMEGGQ